MFPAPFASHARVTVGRWRTAQDGLTSLVLRLADEGEAVEKAAADQAIDLNVLQTHQLNWTPDVDIASGLKVTADWATDESP